MTISVLLVHVPNYSAQKSSQEELSERTVTLLALYNTSRASDIKALDIRFKWSYGNIVFTIPGLTKIRHSDPPKEVYLRK